ncbi:hypothetical protein RA265_27945, partial [Pseudomonas syringae pv. tagetis]|uniref:hypothetical protein n=1 Tax=Pseudomonas syringae group genomosp. 7 TaxID=251699 RepID=UPI00376FABF2
MDVLIMLLEFFFCVVGLVVVGVFGWLWFCCGGFFCCFVLFVVVGSFFFLDFLCHTRLYYGWIWTEINEFMS